MLEAEAKMEEREKEQEEPGCAGEKPKGKERGREDPQNQFKTWEKGGKERDLERKPNEREDGHGSGIEREKFNDEDLRRREMISEKKQELEKYKEIFENLVSHRGLKMSPLNKQLQS